MTEDEKDRIITSAVQQIVEYDRRNYRVRTERPQWEKDYHLHRCIASVAAEVVQTFSERPSSMIVYLQRLAAPTYAPLMRDGLRNRGAETAADHVGTIARTALRWMGENFDHAEGIGIADFDEAEFCGDEARFDPMQRLQ